MKTTKTTVILLFSLILLFTTLLELKAWEIYCPPECQTYEIAFIPDIPQCTYWLNPNDKR